MVAAGQAPPEVTIFNAQGNEVYAWRHAGDDRMRPEKSAETYQVADGDVLTIEFDGPSPTYKKNGQTVFVSPTPYDRSQRYHFKLITHTSLDKPAVFEGYLR
jgi:hypothetical protein